ncbi:MAG TPA: Fic family protein [Casimicrobiaceae bacterium]
MVRGRTGQLRTISSAGGEIAQAFVPAQLPPNPALVAEGELQEAIDLALVAIGRLDSVSTLLPDTHLFLYTYVRQEAVLSSQIEGTQSTLSDLLLFELDETPGVPMDDVIEVSNYVAALEHGLKRVREGFPISNRLIREIHTILLGRGRGADKQPGEFRTSQNWVGGTRPGNATFVPPPPQDVPDCMAHLERFIHNEPVRTPPFTKAALVHVQFETIHPFLDGNGRVGRLLITLLLCVAGLLQEPLLYLSLYLRQHRDEYYDLLNVVRKEGDWERWLAFFARAVRETAATAVATAGKLVATFQEDGHRIRGIGRGAGSALRVHHELQRRPLGSIASLARGTGLTVPTVTAALDNLRELAIVREATGRRRNRIFVYSRYLDTLNERTVPASQPV